VNDTKRRTIEAGQTGLAKKVLEAVPISEAWTIHQIRNELIRTGSNSDYRMIEGCLRTLKDSELVKEPDTGSFIRIMSKPKTVRVSVPKEVQEQTMAVIAEAKKPVEPMDRLAALSAQVRVLSNQVLAIATEIENVALDVQDRLDRIHADTAKLRQLQELLKGL